jgi:hypothetical protein
VAQAIIIAAIKKAGAVQRIVQGLVLGIASAAATKKAPSQISFNMLLDLLQRGFAADYQHPHGTTIVCPGTK